MDAADRTRYAMQLRFGERSPPKQKGSAREDECDEKHDAADGSQSPVEDRSRRFGDRHHAPEFVVHLKGPNAQTLLEAHVTPLTRPISSPDGLFEIAGFSTGLGLPKRDWRQQYGLCCCGPPDAADDGTDIPKAKELLSTNSMRIVPKNAYV